MSLEEQIDKLTNAMADISMIPDKIQVHISDSVDTDRIARSLESIADSLSVIARDFR